jgi:hypothetical protein
VCGACMFRSLQAASHPYYATLIAGSFLVQQIESLHDGPTPMEWDTADAPYLGPWEHRWGGEQNVARCHSTPRGLRDRYSLHVAIFG